MSSTSAVVICNLRRLEYSRKPDEIHGRSKMVTHEVRRRNQPIYFIHDDLDATQSCVITSKPGKPEQAPAQPSRTQAKLQMIFQSSRSFLLAIVVFILVAVCTSAPPAQTVAFTDAETHPLNLFQRAQNPHATP